MSDYGFKTLKSGKERPKDIAINAKYTNIGFDLRHKPTPFITVSINDTRTNPYATNGTRGYNPTTKPELSQLTNTGLYYYDYFNNPFPVLGKANKTYGAIDEVIYRVEHGYNFRPAGYAIYTGKLNYNLQKNIVGTPIAGQNIVTADGYTESDYNWNLMRPFNTTTTTPIIVDGTLTPKMNVMKAKYVDVINDHNFQYTIRPSDVPTTSIINNLIKDAVFNFSMKELQLQLVDDYKFPFWIEVDDKYITVYRTYYWCEMWGRLYMRSQSNRGSISASAYIEDEFKIKMVEQTYGSTVDITVMLFPYKMEDIL